MRPSTSPVDIRPDHLETVQEILRSRLPAGVEVWVFGSRANWTTTDSSDLDLAVAGSAKLDYRVMADLEIAFEESDLPYTVDVIDLNNVSDAFNQIVKNQRVALPSLSYPRKLDGAWHEVALREVADLNEETYSPKEAWPFVNYLDTGSITENRIAEIQKLEDGKDKIPSRARRKVQPGDIVYSTVRPNQRHFGLLKSIPENFLASTGFAVLRGKEGITDTGFLYWFLAQDHIIEYLHSIAENSTSAYPSIRPSELERLTLALPPLDEQRAIAHILGTLDDKIELNRRMNRTLEEMARAIFQDWFVDFGPTRAKMGGQEPYLPPELWDLFPDELVDSELGEIPEGWEVGVLHDAIEILSGGTPKTSIPEYWNGNIPWYTAKDASDPSDVFVVNTERSITPAGVANSSTQVLPTGTTIITARGTVGRLACLGIPMAMNQTCYGIRGADGYPEYFTYWNVRNTVSDLQSRTHGTIFDTITRDTFKIADAVLAPAEVACAFDEIVNPLMSRILGNLTESSQLKLQRESLLPRLISGEVSAVSLG